MTHRVNFRAARLALALVIMGTAATTSPGCGSTGEPSPETPAPSASGKPGDPSPDGADAGDDPFGTSPEKGPGDPSDVRFIAVGDAGRGDSGQEMVAAAMAHKCKIDGCDFVLVVGDNIYTNGVSSPSDVQFRNKFELPYAHVPVPFFLALGNHDYGSEGMGQDWARAQNEVDYTKRSKKWNMPERYYRFGRGNADFFALDTQAQVLKRAAEQRVAVASWIEQSTATWKIAFGHHPYYSNGTHGNAGLYDGNLVDGPNGSVVKAFADDVYCGKVDLYLSGHDHNRQWMRETCKGTELVVTGGGSEGAALVGINPTRFQSEDLGFLYVHIHGRTLTAEFVHPSGTVNFTRTLTK